MAGRRGYGLAGISGVDRHLNVMDKAEMNHIEAMKQALDALQGSGYYDTTQQREAITALRQALEQEPWDTTDMAYRPGGLSMEQEHESRITSLEVRVAKLEKPMTEHEKQLMAGQRSLLRTTEPPKQPEQNPVAYLYHDTVSAEFANPLTDSTLLVLACDRKPNGRNETPLYTASPKREWKGMTDKEMRHIRNQFAWNIAPEYFSVFARAIEAKLKEKNN